MLTVEERKEIEDEIKLYPRADAACIEALKIVQKHRGWVNDESVKDVASALGMSPEEVEGVATFYTRIYRKPVGRNIILVCDSISCMVMGYKTLYKHLSDKLGIRFGETTPDGRFTLLPNSCLGDCDHAPALMINEDHYNMMTIEKIDALLEKYK